METIQAVGTAWRGGLDRTLGAILLDRRAYARAAEDPSVMTQAVVLVLLAGVAQGYVETGAAGAAWGLVGLASVVANWLLWAAMVHVAVGTRGTYLPLLRALGLAHAPAILRVVMWVPWMADVIVWLWSLAAGVVAVRATLRCSLLKAVLIAALTWIALIVAAMWMGRLAGQEAAMQDMMRQEYLQ